MIQSLLDNTVLDQPKIYTMRELNQHTRQVLDEVNETRRPALITRHGRYIAMIQPLEGVPIEAIVLSRGPLSDAIDAQAADPNLQTYSADEVEQDLLD